MLLSYCAMDYNGGKNHFSLMQENKARSQRDIKVSYKKQLLYEKKIVCFLF